MQNFTRSPIIESKFMGINDAYPSNDPIKMRGFLVKADNAFVTDKITKVTGSSTIANSVAAKSFNGLASFELISSSVKYLVMSINGVSNAQMYYWSGSGNWVALGLANLTNSKRVWFETANNILYGFNGSEVTSWDGTTFTKNPATVPNAFYGKWFHNYFFVANTSANPHRLFWSNLGDPTTFTGTNYVDVNPGDSDQIMGLAGYPGQDELLVFKKNSIWSITGWSGASFSSTTINTQNTNNRIVGYGCVSPFSIVVAGKDTYYFSQLGPTPVIRSLTKTINAITLDGGIISDNIKGTLDGINKSQLPLITGVFDGRYIYWSVPTGSNTYCSQLIVLDTWRIEKGIYPFTTMSGKNAQDFAVSTIPGFATVYFTDDTSPATGYVLKMDTSVYTDSGTAITMDVRTRDYALDLARKAHWKYLYMTYETGSSASVAVNVRIDQATNFTNQKNVSMQGNSPGLGSFILGTSVLGGQGLTTDRTTFQQVLGHNLGIQFKDTTSNAVNIDYFEIYGIPKRLRAN